MAGRKTERATPPARLEALGTRGATDWVVPPASSGTALDAVVRALSGASWSTARGWITSGKIALDGEVVTDPRRPIRGGSALRLEPAAPRPQMRRRAELGAELIVYLDPSVVVVDKPPGINSVVFGDEQPGEWTLDALVRDLLDRRSRAGGGVRGRPPLGVVHRIDRMTSGLLVFTRTVEAKKHLAQQLRLHTVHRRYLALAHGDVKRATLTTFIAANRGDGLRGAVRGRAGRGQPSRGQRAVTHVEPIESLRGATLVACRLETGRTHQIRIHLSEAGHPLVGERVYVRGYGGAVVPAPRLMLHAAELGFVHPATGEQMHFRRDPPEDFAAVLASLRSAANGGSGRPGRGRT